MRRFRLFAAVSLTALLCASQVPVTAVSGVLIVTSALPDTELGTLTLKGPDFGAVAPKVFVNGTELRTGPRLPASDDFKRLVDSLAARRK